MDRIWLRTASLLFFIALGISSCTSQEKKIDVTVIADFGPADRLEVQNKVAVPERSTVFEALRAAFPVATSGR